MIAYKNPLSAYWWRLFMAHPLPVMIVLIAVALLVLAVALWPGKKRR